MDNKTFYDNLYQDEEEKKSFEVRSKIEVFKFIARNNKISFNNKTVLDIGFGSGNILEIIKKLGAKCFGVEISQTAVDRLQNKEYQLKCTDGTTLPYKNNFFDIVIASHTIEHIQDEYKILEEIRRVLKPGGLVIIGVPTGKTGYNPFHFRNYSEKDISRLSNQLHSKCVYDRNFGSPFFNLIYKLNNIIVSIFSRNIVNTVGSTGNIVTKRSYNINRYLYHKLVVNMLLYLYLLDINLINHQGIEIWFLFKKY